MKKKMMKKKICWKVKIRLAFLKLKFACLLQALLFAFSLQANNDLERAMNQTGDKMCQ